MNNKNSDKKIIIIGAGPAGLAAAYKILKNSDYKPVILEASEYIGGISRTHQYNGNRMDLGGHRFFTKSDEVLNFWKEIFPIQDMPAKDDIILNRLEKFKNSGTNPETEDNLFLIRKRLSRIYFMKKLFDYPISFKASTFFNLGLFNVIKAGTGYMCSCIFKRKEKSLEDFYINRFGKPLYNMFFEDYTEKLWGIHPSKIAPDWGKQRVKGLSLIGVLKNCIFKPFISKKQVETSLIEEFMYPKKGPGQFYEILAEQIEQLGGKIILNSTVNKIEFNDSKISKIHAIDKNNNENVFEADEVFSSMPIKDLINSFDNIDINDEIKDIAQNLPYRDFITVGLLVNKLALKNNSKYKTVSDIIPDCWIYIQERNVKLGRLQIFNNWSPYLVNDLENTVWLGLEYFCEEGDKLWTTNDNDFIKFATSELHKIGIIDEANVIDSTVVRVKKAYPAYFGTYKDFDKVKKYLDTIDNLYCIGRNGQHRYNNMDHSILTGFIATDSMLNGISKENIWKVNTDENYHETK